LADHVSESLRWTSLIVKLWLLPRQSRGVSLVGLAGHANPDVNFCLIPEVLFTLEDEGGCLNVLTDRLRRRQHAVVVVAEGAAQEMLQDPANQERDKSGNLRLKDMGVILCEEIQRHCEAIGTEVGLKYVDPSYTIRSQPANLIDSAYCLVLAQDAVHAGMAGRTDMVVGSTNGAFTHMPIGLATGERKQVYPNGEEWRYLLEMTGQPASMIG